jgi:hypothetical protein
VQEVRNGAMPLGKALDIMVARLGGRILHSQIDKNEIELIFNGTKPYRSVYLDRIGPKRWSARAGMPVANILRAEGANAIRDDKAKAAITPEDYIQAVVEAGQPMPPHGTGGQGGGGGKPTTRRPRRSRLLDNFWASTSA